VSIRDLGRFVNAAGDLSVAGRGAVVANAGARLGDDAAAIDYAGDAAALGDVASSDGDGDDDGWSRFLPGTNRIRGNGNLAARDHDAVANGQADNGDGDVVEYLHDGALTA
jgi:hypothetical protein